MSLLYTNARKTVIYKVNNVDRILFDVDWLQMRMGERHITLDEWTKEGTIRAIESFPAVFGKQVNRKIGFPSIQDFLKAKFECDMKERKIVPVVLHPKDLRTTSFTYFEFEGIYKKPHVSSSGGTFIVTSENPTHRIIRTHLNRRSLEKLIFEDPRLDAVFYNIKEEYPKHTIAYAIVRIN